jgi:hypothetical protein
MAEYGKWYLPRLVTCVFSKRVDENLLMQAIKIPARKLCIMQLAVYIDRFVP